MSDKNSTDTGSRAKYFFVTGLTIGRAPLIFAFMIGAVYASCHPELVWLPWLNLAFMIGSAVTDLFDGMLARKWKVTSKFGALCDPLTDKVFYAVAFPTLTALIFKNGEVSHGVLMLFFTVAYLLRDQWVSFLRALASGKADMRASWSGKWRTALSFPIGCAIYAYVSMGWFWLPIQLIVGLEIFGLILNFYSLYAYTKRYGFALKEAMK